MKGMHMLNKILRRFGLVALPVHEVGALRLSAENNDILHDLLHGRCLNPGDETAVLVAQLRSVATAVEGATNITIVQRHLCRQFVTDFWQQAEAAPERVVLDAQADTAVVQP